MMLPSDADASSETDASSDAYADDNGDGIRVGLI